MKLWNKNLNKEIIYVAEIGVNHEGNLRRCLKLVKLAKKAGADVVKFQCFTPSKYYSIEEEKYKQAKKFYFEPEKFVKIIKFCKKININFLFTALTEDWINFIKKHSNTIKIASGDLNFKHIIKLVTKKNLNIILSTGISDENEISQTYKIIKKAYKKKINKKLILMHCVSNYPVENYNVNLNNLKNLEKKFNTVLGYSNHAIGIEACLASICLNARIIEFHFTDNKRRKFRDHQLSLDITDVKKLIHIGNIFNKLLGKPDRKDLPKYLKSLKKKFNKGIIANKLIKKNQKINFKDLAFARTAKFMNANEYDQIINKRVKKSIKAGQYLKKNFF